MTDDELKTVLQDSFVPYAQGYCNQPSQVTLRLRVNDERIAGTLTVSQADFNRLDANHTLYHGLADAFRDLCFANDSDREAAFNLVGPA